MSSEAWFLHKYSQGDSSARVSLFTREQGIVSCLFRGARSSKKRHFLQAFTLLWFSLAHKNEWYYVNSIEIAAAPLVFSGASLFAAMYINELIWLTLKPMDPHPELYDLYEYTLKGLTMVADRMAIESLLRRFEWVLLSECGYRFSYPEEEKSSLVSFYQYVPGVGFSPAHNGFSETDLQALVAGDFTDVTVLKAAKRAMRQAIDHLLGGREIKSRSLFKPVNTVR